MIQLNDHVPVARGGEREVFLHPADPSRLLKVLSPAAKRSKGGPARAFFSRVYGGYRTYLLRREYEEYLRLSLAHLDRKTPLPVAHLFGFEVTDRGLACATEAVRDTQGALGRSWRQMVKKGDVGAAEVDAMTELGRNLIGLGVRCSDLTAGNIVLGHRSIGGEQGPYEAVLIDGLGDTHAIPIRTWSKRANAHSIQKRLERIGAKAGLHWDRDETRFVKAN